MPNTVDVKSGSGRLALLIALALSGCSFTQADSGTDAAGVTEQSAPTKNVQQKMKAKQVMQKTTGKNESQLLEHVSGVAFTDSKVSFSVISTGCTSASDFKVEHAIVNGACEVTINRTKPDLCRRAPYIYDVVLDWAAPAQCEQMSIFVANPMLVTAPDDLVIKRVK